jgi:hypothetical protein
MIEVRKNPALKTKRAVAKTIFVDLTLLLER